MKKEKFINELKKRLKYVEENEDSVRNVFGWKHAEGVCNLKRYRVEVAEIDHANQKEVHRDTIYFWVKDRGRSQEKVIDVRWEGMYFRIDEEVEEILAGQNVYIRNERVGRRKRREKILEGDRR